VSTIKTGISIDRRLFQEAGVAARELKMSRSRLFAQALSDFLERRRNCRLFEELNDAYATALRSTDEERKVSESMRKHQRRLVEGSW